MTFLSEILLLVVLFLLTLVPLLISVAYVILAERKIMASIQRRVGPNVVGSQGLLQPFIDAVKLITKELLAPLKANIFMFVVSPQISLGIALLLWMFIPFESDNYYYDFNFGLLWVFAISSFSVYGVVVSGWASNSKYALLGSIRTISQFISYELILTLSVFPIIFVTESLNFIEIVNMQLVTTWFLFPFCPLAYTFFVACLAETNRTPFDLPEAEAELVAGYNVEYSGIYFIFFMFAEYSGVLFMSSLFTLLFLAGWGGLPGFLSTHEFWFAIKLVCVVFCFICIRATQPRWRFDQLLLLSWKRLLPLSFMFFIFSCALYLYLSYGFINRLFFMDILGGLFIFCLLSSQVTFVTVFFVIVDVLCLFFFDFIVEIILSLFMFWLDMLFVGFLCDCLITLALVLILFDIFVFYSVIKTKS